MDDRISRAWAGIGAMNASSPEPRATKAPQRRDTTQKDANEGLMMYSYIVMHGGKTLCFEDR